MSKNNRFNIILIYSLFALNIVAANSVERYVTQKDELFFVLEKVTPENYETWLRFARTQAGLCRKQNYSELTKLNEEIKAFERDLEEEQKKEQPSATTIKNKKECIQLYQSYIAMNSTPNDKLATAMNDCFKRQEDILIMSKNKGVDVWMGYVSPKNPHDINYGEFLNSDIEMAVTVSSSLDLPMVMYMGISRVPTYMLDKEKVEHKRLAKSLMAFIAGIMAEKKGKLYMSTVPLRAIYALLSTSLKFFKTGLEIDEYMMQQPRDKNYWTIKNVVGNTIFEGRAPQWSWFVEYTRFLTNKQVLIDLHELKTHFSS
jgi:hypothetical protein